MNTHRLAFILLLAVAAGCRNSANEFDATGNFEADEVIISSETAGRILKLEVEEGKELEAHAAVGLIDTIQLYLRKKQLEYSIRAVVAKTPNSTVQLAAIKEQMETAQREKKRVENLLKDDAATQKQLDDLNAQIQLLQRQYDASQSNLSITTQSIQSETLPLKAQLDQVQDQLNKSVIYNPFKGTVLTQYALKDEMAAQGKALYKVADLSTLILRAYISGSQLSQIKLGQNVEVLVDAPDDTYKKYAGTVMWVSEKAEFTPKTIMTKEERANLVYAVKIRVMNDGYLKLGMYGEVNFVASEAK
jgi:HlyD family secretion protein